MLPCQLIGDYDPQEAVHWSAGTGQYTLASGCQLVMVTGW